jgi:hypothetical protein
MTINKKSICDYFQRISRNQKWNICFFTALDGVHPDSKSLWGMMECKLTQHLRNEMADDPKDTRPDQSGSREKKEAPKITIAELNCTENPSKGRIR